MPDTFAVTVAHQPAQTVVAVAGEMDLATCPEVAAAAARRGRLDTLRLELSAMPFMDPAGLNLLLGPRSRMQERGGRLVLADLQAQPRHVLELTQSYALFEIVETRGTATGAGIAAVAGALPQG